MKTFLWVKSILGGINTISLFEFVHLVTLCFLSTVLAPCSRTVQAARADRYKGIHGAEDWLHQASAFVHSGPSA